jgi:hypothetical protein
MNKPLNHDSIAKAMKEAAWVAKHGTREERAGRFIPPRAPSQSAKPEQKQGQDD